MITINSSIKLGYNEHSKTTLSRLIYNGLKSSIWRLTLNMHQLNSNRFLKSSLPPKIFLLFAIMCTGYNNKHDVAEGIINST